MKARWTAVILIDLENQTDLNIEVLRAQLVERFYLVEQLAFADYSRPSLRSLAGHLECDRVTQVHVNTSNGTGYIRNKVDQVMARILDRFAQREHMATIVVVSGDNYFTQSVRRARRLGKRVIVAANPDRTGRRLLKAADEFISLGRQRTSH